MQSKYASELFRIVNKQNVDYPDAVRIYKSRKKTNKKHKNADNDTEAEYHNYE